MRVRDLGVLMVEIDGLEQPLPGRRPQVILARLLLDVNRRVSASEIIDAVWGDDPTDRTSTLESHIWRLRRVLEPGRTAHQPPQVLVADNEGYRLVARIEDVDSLQFERQAGEIRELVAAGDAQRILRRCDEALALWRGRPYEPVSEELWVAPAVARLAEVRTGIALSRLDALLDLGHHQQVLADLEKLLADAPLNERFWTQRMLALYRAGRTDQALGAYQRIRELLDDELGLRPGVELEQMQRRILEQDPGLDQPVALAVRPTDDAAPSVNLPARTTPLIGRSGDLGQLTRLLERSRLVSITGVAGCGKTRLAVELAYAMTPAFTDGVCFVDLASIEDASMVAELVASSLRLAPTVAGSAREATVDYLRRRRLLLVLDNCEHVVWGVAEFIDQLADPESRCSLLLTSREAVASPGEVIWTLGPLPLGAATPSEQSPAAELLLARLAEVVPALDIDDTVRSQAEKICEAVDGLPLAIELAAARVRTDGLAAVAAQVALDPGRLRQLGRAGGSHHHSLAEAIDWSYRLLSPDEKLLHRKLSVLPGPFTANVAAALAARSDRASEGLDAETVPDVLALLTHRSLLVTVPSSVSSGRPRFRQLATVRSHARHALIVGGEAKDDEAARDRWVQNLLAGRPRPFGPDHAAWYDAVEDDYDAVRGTLHHLLVEEPTSAGVRVATGLGTYWYLRGRMIEGLSWLQLAAAFVDADPVESAEVDCDLAVQLVLQGRTDLASRHVERARAALQLAVPADRLANLAWAVAGLAYALLTGSERELVWALTNDVRAVAVATGDTDLVLVAEALSATSSATPYPGEVQSVHERAIEAENTFAALICTSFFSLFALLTRDPHLGQVWVTRGRELHERIGGRAFSGFDENGANFAAMAGDHRAAAALYGASSAAAYRDGTVWPRQRATAGLLHRTESAMTHEEFLSAWRSGERMMGGS